MQARFTQSYVNSLKRPEKPYWVSDDGCQNLRLYVGPKGKVWYAGYRDADGKKQSRKLGSASVLTVVEARNEAIKLTARVISGENLKDEKPVPTTTYGDFLKDHYAPWVIANRKSGKETVQSITAAFAFLFDEPLENISMMSVEQWRMKRTKMGRKAATLNRLIVALKASLNWAVKHKIIESNPLDGLERLKEHDSDKKIRYLSPDERQRLMLALDNRERRLREERKSHNDWLRQRGLEVKSELAGQFVDHLKPLVLISLNSGIRQGSLFGLLWSDVDFATETVMLRGENNKPGHTTHLPVNSIVTQTLRAWREQSRSIKDSALVFPSPVTGKKLDNVNKSWAAVLKEAEIKNFRWHDMRHDFASQLVMKGVDLNTVRELMGHADMKMTMRYAHLAPSSKLRAVEVLVENTL
ncbi:site-specific integrase [Synergistaceae bacterium OttesenSCG-928-I11]|nr:site-specific integrase [Synergistaceae bacterium OttesenSCG-928-I11]